MSKDSHNSGLALQSSPDAQVEVAKEIHSRFHAMKTYGKQPEALASITTTMLNDLSDFPAETIMKAFKTHAQRNQEFPTTADIIGIIKRNGKPALKESDVIAIRKKDAELRTGDDWKLLRDWDYQQSDGWSDNYYDTAKEESKDAEITRLRMEIQELRRENGRAWAEVKNLRSSQPIPSHEIGLEERIKNSVDDMRARGAPESDIQEFLEAFAA